MTGQKGQAQAMKNVVAVRWLGAYDAVDVDLVRSAKWEMKAEREVAFAYMHPNGPRVGSSYVGLLVDVHKSTIRARYLGDAYTVLNDDGVTLRNTRSYTVRVKKGQTPRLAVCKSLGNVENSYDEAVGFLKFSGVVVHPTAPKKMREEAIRVAEAIGLPYLGSLSGDLKPKTPRPQPTGAKTPKAKPSCPPPPPPKFINLKVGVKSAKAILAAEGYLADGDKFTVDRKGKKVYLTLQGKAAYIQFYRPLSLKKDPCKARYQLMVYDEHGEPDLLGGGLIWVNNPGGEIEVKSYTSKSDTS